MIMIRCFLEICPGCEGTSPKIMETYLYLVSRFLRIQLPTLDGVDILLLI